MHQPVVCFIIIFERSIRKGKIFPDSPNGKELQMLLSPSSFIREVFAAFFF